MKSIRFKPLIVLVNLLFVFNLHSYGGEIIYNFFTSTAYKMLITAFQLFIYPLLYITYKLQHKNVNLIEEILTDAIKFKNSILTHIILSIFNIDPNYISPSWNPLRPSLLHHACKHDDLYSVEKLLAFPSINPNTLNFYKKTPLSIIMSKEELDPDQLKIIKLFIEHPKTNVNTKTCHYPLLEWACHKGHIDIAKLLLKHQNIILKKNYYDTYIRLAPDKEHKEILNVLLKHPKADSIELFKLAIEYGDKNLVISLLNNDSHKKNILKKWQIAYETSHSNRPPNIEIIKMLIANLEIDVNQPYPESFFEENNFARVRLDGVLFWACKNGHTELVELLLDRPDIKINNMGSSEIKTCLRISHKEGHKKIFNMLSNHATIDPVELFAIALENSNIETIKKLLKQYQLNILEGEKKDSLPKAAKIGNAEIFQLLLEDESIKKNPASYNEALYEAVKSDNETFVKLLLQIPDIDISQEYKNCTAFSQAIRANNLPIMQLLYNHTNDIVNKRFKGTTPLLYTLEINNNIDIINFLIDIGNTNVLLKDDNNKTFFHHLLLEHQYFNLNRLNFFNNYDDLQKKEFINSQLESFAYIKFPDRYKDTIHQYAKNFIDSCKRYGGDLNQRTNKNRPVDAAQKQYALCAQLLEHNSAQFIIKEKIYHNFLNHTDTIPDHELHYRLKEILGPNIKNTIMRYYYAVTINKKIASKISHSTGYYYYEKSAPEKREEKLLMLNETYKKLGILNQNNFFT